MKGTVVRQDKPNHPCTCCCFLEKKGDCSEGMVVLCCFKVQTQNCQIISYESRSRSNLRCRYILRCTFSLKMSRRQFLFDYSGLMLVSVTLVIQLRLVLISLRCVSVIGNRVEEYQIWYAFTKIHGQQTCILSLLYNFKRFQQVLCSCCACRLYPLLLSGLGIRFKVRS